MRGLRNRCSLEEKGVHWWESGKSQWPDLIGLPKLSSSTALRKMLANDNDNDDNNDGVAVIS